MLKFKFLNALNCIQLKYKTVYMWGTFGSPVTESLIQQKAAQYPSYYPANRQAYLRTLIGKNYWAFDCVGLIKGILWGWKGLLKKPDGSAYSYGGATYNSNGVPDTTASGIYNRCSNKTTLTSNISIPIGSFLLGPDHCGVYIGNNQVIECTLRGNKDGVALTGIGDFGWKSIGQLPDLSGGNGDVNSDGIIDELDDLVLSRYLSNFSGISINRTNSDVNGDGIIDDVDSMLLSRHLSNWEIFK